MLPDTMMPCDALTKRFGHFTAVDGVSFMVVPLNEPPEPSPGLGATMPWVNHPQMIMRPERAQET